MINENIIEIFDIQRNIMEMVLSNSCCLCMMLMFWHITLMEYMHRHRDDQVGMMYRYETGTWRTKALCDWLIAFGSDIVFLFQPLACVWGPSYLVFLGLSMLKCICMYQGPMSWVNIALFITQFQCTLDITVGRLSELTPVIAQDLMLQWNVNMFVDCLDGLAVCLICTVCSPKDWLIIYSRHGKTS